MTNHPTAKKAKRASEGERLLCKYTTASLEDLRQNGVSVRVGPLLAKQIDRAIRRCEKLIVENICRNIMLERDGRWSDNASLCAWIGMWSKECPPTRKAIIERCRIKAAVLKHLRRSKGAKL